MKKGRVLLLTGPPATGKNTIGELLAGELPHGVLIDVDAVRQMVHSPHKAPWEGEEGLRQQKIGVENACCLASRFVREGFDTVILDVLSDATAAIYRKCLSTCELRIVRLLPDWDTIWQRNHTRPMYLKEEEIRALYRLQQEFSGADYTVDNRELSPQQAAELLRELLDSDSFTLPVSR